MSVQPDTLVIVKDRIAKKKAVVAIVGLGSRVTVGNRICKA